MNELIVRIAARGDGVTASGRHVRFGVPGDALLDDGALAPGPHHVDPPCGLFPQCGGCQLQHADDEAYRGYLKSRVETALAQHLIATRVIEPHLSPPKSRRRASLRALKVASRSLVGFNAGQSQSIVDMSECHILRPELFELVDPLRSLLTQLLTPKRTGEVQLTLADEGIDAVLKGIAADNLGALQRLGSFAAGHGLARLSIDQGLGPETIFEPFPTTITLSGISVRFPIGAFLQATADGEDALIQAVRLGLEGATNIADLFSGIGTFALAVGARYSAEASRAAVEALKEAAPAMTVEHRDLYRRPLDGAELQRFDAVILDPPRAGALDQVTALAGGRVRRIAYVSCNPATFARDAKLLTDGGYRLEWVKPVGQFRWSTHVELASAFVRCQ